MTGTIVHVVAGLGRSQGGPSYSAPRLCSAEREAGAEIRLCAVDNPVDQPIEGVDAELHRQDYANVPVIGRMRVSRSLRSHLEAIVPAAGLVHVHGIWLMPNIYAGNIARRSNRPMIVSPRGMLAREALSISRAQKLAVWALLQRRAYSQAALWHATCEAEADEIRAFGIRAPIAVIPNGVDMPPLQQAARPRSKTLLYLGRLHPKKGLADLVRAWAVVSKEAPDWRLRVVGPDENGHAADLQLLAAQTGVERLAIEPPVFGALKAQALADASVFILPTRNENFGIAVAEALGGGMPAIVTRGAPWSGLVAHNCGWWIDHGVAPMAEAIRAAIHKSPGELHEMGERGRRWVSRDFAWGRIAADMLEVYDWVVRRGAAPETVRLN